MAFEVAKRIRQRPQLFPRLNISLEQNIAGGLGVAEEIPLFRR